MTPQIEGLIQEESGVLRPKIKRKFEWNAWRKLWAWAVVAWAVGVFVVSTSHYFGKEWLSRSEALGTLVTKDAYNQDQKSLDAFILRTDKIVEEIKAIQHRDNTELKAGQNEMQRDIKLIIRQGGRP